MLGTSRPAVRFCCPECGAVMRAPRADAGGAIDCPRCGEPVRVPRFPHPVESDADDGPLVPVNAANDARSGLRLLTASLGVWVFWFALTAGTVVVWAADRGPPAVLNRDPGDLREVLLAAVVGELALVWVGAGLRWVGYGRCRAAADAVRAGGWVAAARVGVILTAVGQTVAAGPAVVGLTPDETTGVLTAFAVIADFARVAGVVLEFGVLFAWGRLLTEGVGRGAAGRVSNYLLTVAAAIGATVAGLCAAAVVAVAAANRTAATVPPRPPTPLPKLNYAAVPSEAWDALGAVGGAVSVLAVVLCWQYFRILTATRAALDPTPGQPLGPGRTPPIGA